MSTGPKFIRFCWPIVAALRELGGAAKPAEIVEAVIDAVGIPDDERSERTKGGSLRVVNQVHWARNYLVWDGLLDGTERGRWKLSETGWSIALAEQTPATALELFRRVREQHEPQWGNGEGDEAGTDALPEPTNADEAEAFKLENDLRRAVLNLSPTGFERLCKRVLAEIGLEQLRAVGQSGDRGIDVEGQLRLSSVVSFRVGVQCKRYADGNPVSPRQVRELQGAIGPFDRGIFITTSVFSKQAEEQATAPGYKPIDLIDGERLIQLLLERGLGVKTETVVDPAFFGPLDTADH